MVTAEERIEKAREMFGKHTGKVLFCKKINSFKICGNSANIMVSVLDEQKNEIKLYHNGYREFLQDLKNSNK